MTNNLLKLHVYGFGIILALDLEISYLENTNNNEVRLKLRLISTKKMVTLHSIIVTEEKLGLQSRKMEKAQYPEYLL